MTGPFSLRRRAEQFDSALARTAEPLNERDARQFAELLAVVSDLRSIPELQPRADFVTDLRSRLMIEAETVLLPQSTRPLTAVEQRLALPVRSNQRDRRLATLLGGAALVGATTSMAVAAQTALPGESLYSVKRALENVETQLARGESAKGEVLLANASGRLDEIDRLADDNSPGSAAAIEATLATFSDQASEASQVLSVAYAETGDEAVIIDLRTFAISSLDRLSELQSALPVEARDELVEAGQLLQDIDARASDTCPTCGGEPVAIPLNLQAGSTSSQDVGALILAASEDPALTRPAPPTPAATPAPISGQDVDGVEVPDLNVPGTDTTPSPLPTTIPDSGTAVPGTNPDGTVPLTEPVNEVTKLLTGDLNASSTGTVTDEVVSGVGTAVDGTLAELEDALGQTTGSALP